MSQNINSLTLNTFVNTFLKLGINDDLVYLANIIQNQYIAASLRIVSTFIEWLFRFEMGVLTIHHSQDDFF